MVQGASFGAELRRRRVAAGMSLGGLAERVKYSKGYLSKVERRQKNASPELARVCDHELGAGGELSALVAERGTSASTDTEAPTEWTMPWVLRMSVHRGNDFVAYDESGLGDPAVRPGMMSWRMASSVELDGEARDALAHFSSLFAECRNLGQSFGPVVVTQILVTSMNALRGLAGSASRSDDREATLRLAARYAEYAGWMTQEAADDAASLWWTDRALALARAGGDTEFAAYTLVRRADVALYRMDGRSTVEYARLAEEQARSLRIRGLAAQRRAQGHALLGEDAACFRALDRAAELMTRAARASADEPVAPGTEPVIGSMHLAELADFVAGWCLHDLGRTTEAVDRLEGGLDAIPVRARRARARYGARLALALADAGDLKSACAIVDAVTSSVSVVDSATIRADLQRLARRLNRWPRDPEARLAATRISAALHVGDR
ncbi:helix-turn-helix transcriptional regulator [Streptomyces sp. DSM 41014]|uniref:Helix-turn-helix transcriptional regulator n=1 Tax=Streptomyces hintoniae TaxID=3075521 RepID=A0ABU2UV87_9ACTN|nr:helix-turn-helix transcriptional regulator [Streptomyces sp. DSM 41014]MDT0477200.1 helix-turn-helix transcriptional regulator [Streptomyces sp. DSM 41014]